MPNVIYAPVEMPSEVAAVLGITGNDLDAVCKSNNINMWAKYKPVVFATIFTLTDTQRALANYGIHNIPTWGLVQHGSVVTMMNFWLCGYKTDANAPDCGVQPVYWSYLKPSGGSQSPYRLSDFAKDTTLGYFHGAEPPIGPIANTTIEINPAGQLSINYVNGAQDSKTLKYTDLMLETGGYMSLAGYYFGVALVRTSEAGQSNATEYVQTEMTAADAVSLGAHVYSFFQDDSHLSAFMGGGNVRQNTFYIMPFLSNGEMYDTFTSGQSTMKKFLTSFNGVTANKFAALLERQQVTIIRKYADVKVIRLTSARRSGHTGIIDTDYEVENEMTDNGVTITNLQLEYLDVNGVQIYTHNVAVNPINIASGGSYIGSASHTFGSAGTANIYNVRMTVQTLQGVISFLPAESVKIALVTG
jgi:hypothetical protein